MRLFSPSRIRAWIRVSVIPCLIWLVLATRSPAWLMLKRSFSYLEDYARFLYWKFSYYKIGRSPSCSCGISHNFDWHQSQRKCQDQWMGHRAWFGRIHWVSSKPPSLWADRCDPEALDCSRHAHPTLPVQGEAHAFAGSSDSSSIGFDVNGWQLCRTHLCWTGITNPTGRNVGVCHKPKGIVAVNERVISGWIQLWLGLKSYGWAWSPDQTKAYDLQRMWSSVRHNAIS